MQRSSPSSRRAAEFARRVDLPAIRHLSVVSSTMDEAHRWASEGAPAGALVLADAQQAGRGRMGRAWLSAPGAGIWMTLIERPKDPKALDVLSLRIGMAAARVLDRFAGEEVRLKWPNDLLLDSGKLGGILIETRWREERVEWVAVGVGVNLIPPEGAAGLRLATDRFAVLEELVPALRAACFATGLLHDAERDAWDRRDALKGRRLFEPARGVAEGIAADGALLVRTAEGTVPVRGGTVIFDAEG
ncbi:MAG: biotin--[acetyl-CoA-carboxylase] ligase [Gemmatimonadaceae bacterium]|nr:biotin--[acetyl-CoA-carboxylase] ligase [Gemmatimonadaceae bacterium]